MSRTKVKELAEQIRGVSYKPEDLHDSLNEDSVILLRANNISDGRINFDDVVYVDKRKVSKDQYLKMGDILICASSGSKALVGKAASVDFSKLCTFGAFCKVIRPKAGFEGYLGAFFQSAVYRKRISEVAIGANINNVRNEHVDDIELPLYSEKVNEDIVKRISVLQGIITKRKIELNGLNTLVKSRFVEMFGEPIANPKGWLVKPLKELSTLITNGNTPKGGSENYVESGITFLRSQNVWRNRIELDDVAYIDEATHKSMMKSSLHHKDILITKTGRINTENSSLGRAALFLGDDDSANINGHIYLIRLTDEVIPEYVVTILTGEAYRKYIRKVCVGGIDKRQINVDQVEDFPIIMPPLDQQKIFAEFRKQIEKLKVAVQKSLDETQLLFDSLMQQYFG